MIMYYRDINSSVAHLSALVEVVEALRCLCLSGLVLKTLGRMCQVRIVIIGTPARLV